ncbi:MAG: NAD(P)/FAD-dependent oxidoreductase [Chitinophagaceae bacterium]|nr:MAG: NAD(P)/FAD-dependent oxidoreductase [Chitinophagaceae bacterium]
MKVLVIGGGIFGTSAASLLADKDVHVDLVESQNDILKVASRVNHNRVHLGYHYLRSIETAEQSLEGLLSFLFHFGSAVVYQFPNYYAIAKEGSKTNTAQFLAFCERVGIGFDEEMPPDNLFNRSALESCFRVPEPVYDHLLLKKIMKKKLQHPNINVYLNTNCVGLKHMSDGTFEAKLSTGTKTYDVVLNCTYSNINQINSFLDIPEKRLLYEDVIIPVFKYPSPAFGLTVMDGPFCSVMPRGMQRNEFLLYHVKESVLNREISLKRPDFKVTKFTKEELTGPDGIYDKASHFMPFLKNIQPAGYNQVTRSVYENDDDARITELYTYDGLPNYFTILSGKVTTCIQAALEIKHIIQGRKLKKRFIMSV